MALSAGENGTPSSTSIIITEIGLSPLMLGLAGVVHEWAKVCDVFKTKRKQQLAQIVLLLYHIGVATAIAIYAVGASNSFKQPPKPDSKGVEKAGIILLLLFWLALYAAFGLLTCKIGLHKLYTFFLALVVALVLLGIRVIYQTVATFGSSPSFNQVNGSIVFRVVLQFVPGALIILAMVTAGVATIGYEHVPHDPTRQQLPLHSQDVSSARSRGGGR